MRTRLLIAVVVVLLSGLLLSQISLAMSSAHYRLDWFTPLTGGGGGAASSAHYAINFTVGQTVIGASSSASYQVGLGYWYGAASGGRVYLPLILK